MKTYCYEDDTMVVTDGAYNSKIDGLNRSYTGFDPRKKYLVDKVRTKKVNVDKKRQNEPKLC